MSERASAPDDQRSGILISTSQDTGQVMHQDTVSCCHCGRLWVWKKGSGRKRGFCLLCNGFTCGNETCDKCVPKEQQIENMEAGRPLDYRPVRIAIPGSVNDGISR